MAIKKYTLDEFMAALAALLQEHMDGAPATGSSPTPATKGGKGRPKVAEVADEDDDTETDDNAERRAELEGMTIAALRKLAVKEGFDKDEVAEADKEEIIESLLDDDDDLDDDEDADEEDADDEDEDEDEDEAEEYDRDELMELGLRELKKIAKEEADLTPADMKGWDKEQVVDAILGEEAEEEEDDDEGDDEEEWSREELEEMSLGELKALAKEWDIRIRPGTKKDKIIDALLEEDDDE